MKSVFRDLKQACCEANRALPGRGPQAPTLSPEVRDKHFPRKHGAKAYHGQDRER